MSDVSKKLKPASTVAFLILVAAIVALAFRHSLLATRSPGLVAQALAVGLMIWARLKLKWRSFHAAADPSEGELITSGPYHLIRHPIYAAIFYFLVAGVISQLSLINVGLALAAVAALAVRVVAEEWLLLKKYPEYDAYAARTKRIIPFLV